MTLSALRRIGDAALGLAFSIGGELNHEIASDLDKTDEEIVERRIHFRCFRQLHPRLVAVGELDAGRFEGALGGISIASVNPFALLKSGDVLTATSATVASSRTPNEGPRRAAFRRRQFSALSGTCA